MFADGIVREREEVIRELRVIGDTIGEDLQLDVGCPIREVKKT